MELRPSVPGRKMIDCEFSAPFPQQDHLECDNVFSRPGLFHGVMPQDVGVLG